MGLFCDREVIIIFKQLYYKNTSFSFPVSAGGRIRMYMHAQYGYAHNVSARYADGGGSATAERMYVHGTRICAGN